MRPLEACGFIVLQLGFIVMFALFTEYQKVNNTGYVPRQYTMWQDVHVMIFIGFGFLMAFLFKNSFTTVGHSFMIASFAVLWALLNEGFWHQVFQHGRNWHRIPMNYEKFIKADFCAGAVLISFGAVVGRLSSLQLVVMAIIEVVIYNLNESIMMNEIVAADAGGSMTIHMFGAYFGLAVCWVLSRKQKWQENKDEKSNHNSDVIAMIGTLFLWCFWPSFNAVLTYNENRAVTNTLLSILSSVLLAFYMSAICGQGKISMVHVQNATLAGGVAMGTAADMVIHPGTAIAVGSLAGLLSVIGYVYIQPALERVFKFRDVCGVHNLHGMPGLLGAFVGVFAATCAYDGTYVDGSLTVESVFPLRPTPRTRGEQSGYQFAALLMTLGWAIVFGIVTGIILLYVPGLEAYYNDKVEYVVEEEEGEKHESHEPMDAKEQKGIEMHDRPAKSV